jgi:glutamine amidotransferase
MIAVIDYGAGNLSSIRNMLNSVDAESVITSDPKEIEAATKLILPGVGAFDHGVSRLMKSNLIDVLNHQVLEVKTPILGICLGAQLFTERSEEGDLSGLGWIEGATVKFDSNRLKTNDRVPHMAWCDVELMRPHWLFNDMPEEPRFYFVHSYHIACRNTDNVLLQAVHGYSFAAGVEKDNIIGVQFHPEKSHKFGKVLLRNFAQN